MKGSLLKQSMCLRVNLTNISLKDQEFSNSLISYFPSLNNLKALITNLTMSFCNYSGEGAALINAPSLNTRLETTIENASINNNIFNGTNNNGYSGCFYFAGLNSF
jgi:hypothetical protein